MSEKQESKKYVPKAFAFKKIKKKRCKMCINKIDVVDYKDANFLKNYITERGKIVPRRVSGNCAKHQRIITRAIKKSREAGFLPFQID
jgi:small subunit ribosomal protein S18